MTGPILPPVITAEVVLRETGRHPNITRHRERLAARIDAEEDREWQQAVAIMGPQ